MYREPWPKVTPARLEYLRAVSNVEYYLPRHGVVANQCLRLGWVESCLRLPDGTVLSWSDTGPNDWEDGMSIGERLTGAGRAILDASTGEGDGR